MIIEHLSKECKNEFTPVLAEHKTVAVFLPEKAAADEKGVCYIWEICDKTKKMSNHLHMKRKAGGKILYESDRS